MSGNPMKGHRREDVSFPSPPSGGGRVTTEWNPGASHYVVDGMGPAGKLQDQGMPGSLRLCSRPVGTNFEDVDQGLR